MHRGFLAAWLSVRNNVISTLATWPGKRLFLTGHSLGGALAMLAAADLHIAAAAQEIAGVYTFGQPRVGNKVFAQMFDMMLRDRTFRVVHRADIVPHVPWLLGRYRHAGIECFFDRDGSYRENPPWLWQTGMEALATWRGWRQYRAVDISDHFIDSYLRLFQSTAETKEAA